MTQQLIDLFAVRQELVNFLRNSNILSTSVRGVTTTTATGTFSGESSLIINVATVKNIRSVVVALATLTYGLDYTVDFYYLNATVRTCKITFASAQNGAYTITYDYGNDKIWDDYPRDDLSISSYPRIAVDLLGISTDNFGIGGNELISEITFTVTVFAQAVDDINSYLATIRKKFLESRKTFYYLKFISPSIMGPLIEDPEKKQQIMRQNQDFTSQFNVETIA